jgi:hypothetical protein
VTLYFKKQGDAAEIESRSMASAVEVWDGLDMDTVYELGIRPGGEDCKNNLSRCHVYERIRYLCYDLFKYFRPIFLMLAIALPAWST